MTDVTAPNIVRLARVRDLESLDCQILHSTDKLIIASELSESLDLDGLCLLPTNTVRSFDRDFDRAAFYNAAVGLAQPSKHALGLLELLTCELAHDLQVLVEQKEPVAIHLEFDDPDVCFIGSLGAGELGELVLYRIDSCGMRVEEPMKIALVRITKIEVATRYLLAVARAAAALAGKA